MLCGVVTQSSFHVRGGERLRDKPKAYVPRRQDIDPMQKWLPSNDSFVRIQNSLTNLVRDNKFFTIFVSKMRLVRLI